MGGLLAKARPPSPEPMAGFDSILTCARDNDAEGIRAMVAIGCPPGFANKMGQTALHIGSIWGSIEAVKALLDARADPNAQNKLRGSAPLHACAMGRGPADRRAECVKLLIAAKANPRLRDQSGESPLDAAADEELRVALGGMPLHLHKAVQARSRQALAECLEAVRAGRYDLTVDTTNQSGDTALHLAAETSWREGMELLLQAGAAVNCQNGELRCPLHEAALRGQHRLVQLLLERKAEANLKDCNPDHDPRYKSNSDEDNTLEHRTPLHYAAQLCNVACMRLLLEQGAADPNSRDANLETPLYACLHLREPETELEAGGGVKVQGLQNRPAWNDRFASLIGPRLAREDGGEPRWPVLIEGEAGDGVLLKEANLRHVTDEALDLLLAARADVNVGSRSRGETRTVLHEAARTGDAALAAKLLAAGADVDRQDEKLGLTALHVAARGKHHEVARLIVQARADVSQTSSGGKTAAELAQVNGCPEALLALYRGEDAPEAAAGAKASAPQTLESLTPEQRALLFLD